MLIQNTILALLRKKTKRFSQMLLFSFIVTVTFPTQTTFTLGPCGKSEDNLKLNDDG
jgi:hypothetical protein